MAIRETNAMLLISMGQRSGAEVKGRVRKADAMVVCELEADSRGLKQILFSSSSLIPVSLYFTLIK